MIVRCSSCASAYRLDASRLKGGRGKLRCSRCGTVFTVSAADESTGPHAAPAAPATPAPAPRPGRDAGHRAAEALSAARQATSRLNVALVAGEAGAFRQHVVGALGRCGVRTMTADDGPTTIEAARRSRPRLVVVQAALRGISGLEVLDVLRQDPFLAASRIVLHGVPAPSGKYRLSIERVHGVDAHLDESMTPEQLEGIFRALVGLPGGAGLPLVPDEDLRAAARVAVADLLLYEGEGIDEGFRTGRFTAETAQAIEQARGWCLEAFPHPDRQQSPALSAFEEELQATIARRV